MKSILLVSATHQEAYPLVERLNERLPSARENIWIYENKAVELLVTGVGMVATTFALTKRLSAGFDGVCVNMGIAGAFSQKIKIGEVVRVSKDCFADLGVENADGSFTDCFDTALIKEDVFTAKWLLAPVSPFQSKETIKLASGLTVNKVTGSDDSILKLTYEADIETMESAAFFYTCLKFGMPFAAFRSISNRVEARNRANWDIPRAIQSLNNHLINLLEL